MDIKETIEFLSESRLGTSGLDLDWSMEPHDRANLAGWLQELVDRREADKTPSEFQKRIDQLEVDLDTAMTELEEESKARKRVLWRLANLRNKVASAVGLVTSDNRLADDDIFRVVQRISHDVTLLKTEADGDNREIDSLSSKFKALEEVNDELIAENETAKDLLSRWAARARGLSFTPLRFLLDKTRTLLDSPEAAADFVKASEAFTEMRDRVVKAERQADNLRAELSTMAESCERASKLAEERLKDRGKLEGYIQLRNRGCRS